jgi:hypothetical protein
VSLQVQVRLWRKTCGCGYITSSCMSAICAMPCNAAAGGEQVSVARGGSKRPDRRSRSGTALGLPSRSRPQTPARTLVGCARSPRRHHLHWHCTPRTTQRLMCVHSVGARRRHSQPGGQPDSSNVSAFHSVRLLQQMPLAERTASTDVTTPSPTAKSTVPSGQRKSTAWKLSGKK